MTNSLNLWRVSPYLTKSRLVLQNQFNPGDSNDNGAQCERSPMRPRVTVWRSPSPVVIFHSALLNSTATRTRNRPDDVLARLHILTQKPID